MWLPRSVFLRFALRLSFQAEVDESGSKQALLLTLLLGRSSVVASRPRIKTIRCHDGCIPAVPRPLPSRGVILESSPDHSVRTAPRHSTKGLTLECTPGPILIRVEDSMSECCCAAPTSRTEDAFVCPVSGTRSAAVELPTVKALLAERARRLLPGRCGRGGQTCNLGAEY